LGYRVIADELFKKAPTIYGEDARELNEGHEGQTKKQMGRVLWGDPIPNKVPRTKTRHFVDVYKKEVEPQYAAVKAANPTWTHKQIQSYLEENI
jgi:hypothetical protein